MSSTERLMESQLANERTVYGSAAHRGFVVYGNLSRLGHLSFRSGVGNFFFYKGPNSTYFKLHRPHRFSVVTNPLKKQKRKEKKKELNLFGRRVLKTNPREPNLACG